MAENSREDRVDRLLDAVELIKAGEREAALPILRALIREDNDFEDAWMWMSVAVETLDQSATCLDNVLRVNPHNQAAASALHRIRQPELRQQQQRARLRFYRDLFLGAMWLLTALLLLGMMAAYLP
ncbi:MAG: hypothetical protein ACUVSX_01335 [Aggregatilineales bacterium]